MKPFQFTFKHLDVVYKAKVAVTENYLVSELAPQFRDFPDPFNISKDYKYDVIWERMHSSPDESSHHAFAIALASALRNEIEKM